MPDTITAENPRAVIGHNEPPLAEQLVAETEALKQKAEDLIGGASRTVITDKESSEKATLMAKLISTHVDKIDAARKERKAPYFEACKTVDTHFNGIIATLATYDAKGKVIGGPLKTVSDMVDTYRREQERLAAAERARLEAEARAAREAAERAAQAQREAEERERLAAEESARKVREAEAAALAAGNRAAQEAAARARADQQRQEAEASERRMAAELEQRREAERAAELDRRAAASVAAPIDTGLGVKASGRVTRKAVISDWKKAAHGALKLGEADMKATIQTVYDRLARAKVVDLPGATIAEETSTVIR